MIYLLQAKDGGPIKIGSSNNPQVREKQIAALFPNGVEVLATIDGGRVGEGFLHHCFRPVAVATEWFRASPPIWRFLLHVIDHGRPSFIPEENVFPGVDISRAAISEFGGLDEAKVGLGYSQSTTDVFNNGCSVRSRFCFVQSFRRGLLPGYITALHGDSLFAGKVGFDEFVPEKDRAA